MNKTKVLTSTLPMLCLLTVAMVALPVVYAQATNANGNHQEQVTPVWRIGFEFSCKNSTFCGGGFSFTAEAVLNWDGTGHARLVSINFSGPGNVTGRIVETDHITGWKIAPGNSTVAESTNMTFWITNGTKTVNGTTSPLIVPLDTGIPAKAGLYRFPELVLSNDTSRPQGFTANVEVIHLTDA